MRVGGTMTRENGPARLSSICSIISRAALMPISRRDQLTVVSGTRSMSMCAMPPAPTMERSSGTRQPHAKARFEGADRGRVAGDEHRGDVRRHFGQAHDGVVAVLLLEAARHDPLRRDGQTVPRHRRPVPLLAPRGMHERGGPCRCAIRRCPSAIKMLGRQLADLMVVGQHAVTVE